uniref:Uncharacterized protein n=1 Tax=Arundo donax TaxID=35708 RepID=A0A0A9B5L4_ARUDO
MSLIHFHASIVHKSSRTMKYLFSFSCFLRSSAWSSIAFPSSFFNES